MGKKDITDLVQRLDAFEERLGVRIEALSAFVDTEEYEGEVCVDVRGELHAISGTTLQDDLELAVSVYDAGGRVVQTSTDYVEQDSFFGFHTFDMSCYVKTGLVHKIRIVPKPT